MIDNPLTNILIRPNVISPEGIRMVDHIKRSPCEDLSVFDAEKQIEQGKLHGRLIRGQEILRLFPWDHCSPRSKDFFVMP